MFNPKTIARFWKHIEKTDTCWIWKLSCSKKGYGIFHNEFHASAHRFSYILHFGEIPEGLLVCHKCDNPPCIRPDHLFLGTDADNRRDAQQKGRILGYRREICRNGLHNMTDDNILWKRNNKGQMPGRQCLACSITRYQRWYYKDALSAVRPVASRGQDSKSAKPRRGANNASAKKAVGI